MAENVNAVAGGGFFAGPPAGSAGGRPFGAQGVAGGEELDEGGPAGEFFEVVGAVDVEVAEVTTMTWGGLARRSARKVARVSRRKMMVPALLAGLAEEEEVGEDAGGGFQVHAIEDVAAAGDGVDALDAAGESGAAEGVEVLLEGGDEVRLPPAVAVDEDGGLRGEEEAAEGERKGESGPTLTMRRSRMGHPVLWRHFPLRR